jgi:hypothetical protein
VQVAYDISLERFWWRPFALDLISIKGLHTKLWAPKVERIPIVGISEFPFGSPRTKWHLGAGPVAMHKVYYKGEGGGFPQVWVVMSLCLLVVSLCTKMLQLHTNQFFVWFVQVYVSNWTCLWIFLVPSCSSNMPFYPQSAASQGTHPNSFSFRCLNLWTRNWIHQGAWGCVRSLLMATRHLYCTSGFTLDPYT